MTEPIPPPEAQSGASARAPLAAEAGRSGGAAAPPHAVRRSPLTDDWTVPKARRAGGPLGAVAHPAVRGVRVSIGITIAAAGHLLSLVVPYVAGAVAGDQWRSDQGLPVLLWGQAVLGLACLVAGIVLATRRDGGFGIGLIMGWAAGVPVVAWFAGYLLWFLYLS